MQERREIERKCTNGCERGKGERGKEGKERERKRERDEKERESGWDKMWMKSVMLFEKAETLSTYLFVIRYSCPSLFEKILFLIKLKQKIKT